MKKMDGTETGRWAQQFSILGSEKGFRIGESNPGLPRSFMWHFPPELHVGSCLFLFSTLFYSTSNRKGEKKPGKKRREWRKGRKKGGKGA
jgi:hypothetical protein